MQWAATEVALKTCSPGTQSQSVVMVCVSRAPSTTPGEYCGQACWWQRPSLYHCAHPVHSARTLRLPGNSNLFDFLYSGKGQRLIRLSVRKSMMYKKRLSNSRAKTSPKPSKAKFAISGVLITLRIHNWQSPTGRDRGLNYTQCICHQNEVLAAGRYFYPQRQTMSLSTCS